VFEAPGRAALEYALDSPRSVVTVLPPAIGNGSTVAVFRPGRTLSGPAATAHGGSGGSGTEIAAPVKSSRVRAGGFLGLNDESVLEEEVDEKRRWWEFWKE
jgi:hypothetical protein